MTRSQAARQFARSLFARNRRPAGRKPTALGILALEDRIVPAFQDVSGLRFEVPGTFNRQSGRGRDAVSKHGIDRRRPGAPGRGGVRPPGAAGRRRVGHGRRQPGPVEVHLDPTGSPAVTSGTAATLFSGASESQTVADTLPAAADAAPHKGGQVVPVGPFSLTPTGFRVLSANQLGLAGGVGVTDFGGFSLPVAKADKVVTAPDRRRGVARPGDH